MDSGAHTTLSVKMMSHVKLALVLLIAIVVLTVSYATYMLLQSEHGSSLQGEYFEVTDFNNRTVKVPSKVSRIVAIGPGMLRLVVYLNATNLVVGVEASEKEWSTLGRDYAMAYEDFLKKLPIIGVGGPRSPPDPERIRAVKPDLVIMHKLYAQMYDPDRLSREIGVPVIVLDYGKAGYLDINSIKQALRLLGKILHRESRAEELCKYIDQIVSDLKNRVKNVTAKPLVYVGAVSYKGKQPFTSSQSPFPPLMLLNTSSIIDEVSLKPGFVSIDFEYLLLKQPEVIFIDLNSIDIVISDFKKDPNKYCALKAFKKGNVYAILPFNYYHTNVATALADAYYIGKVLHSDQFADINPKEKANEIFEVFLGKPLYEEFVKEFNIGFDSLASVFKCG